MSASQTARWLEQNRVAHGIHVKCRPGTQGWDYDCTISGRGVNRYGKQQRTFGYNVNSHEVTGFAG